MKPSKRQREIEARKNADPIAQVVGREDIDYGTDELPTAPREMNFMGDGDGSGPRIESAGMGPVRNGYLSPVERVRQRIFGDGSGTIVRTYHQPMCEDLNCRGCGPKIVKISDLESAVVEAAIAWRRADIAYDNAESHAAEDKVAVDTAGVEGELADSVDALIASRAEDERERRLSSPGAIRDAQEVKSRFEIEAADALNDEVVSEERERVPREETK